MQKTGALWAFYRVEPAAVLQSEQPVKVECIYSCGLVYIGRRGKLCT